LVRTAPRPAGGVTASATPQSPPAPAGAGSIVATL
jgi:hypothetical protein